MTRRALESETEGTPAVARTGATESESFASLRPYLLGIAYRMLGSLSDAEDVLQTAYLRWCNEETPIESPKAFLSAIVARLSIDQLRLQRTRNNYVGTWLPEPVATQLLRTSQDDLLLAESLSMAFLLLLERLTPVERAVFLLRNVFEYDYDAISEVVGKSETTCRQIALRASKRVATDRQRVLPDPGQHERLTRAFKVAVDTGNMDGLLASLTKDVTLWLDSDGMKGASLGKPIRGAEKVARGVLSAAGAFGAWTAELRSMNGLSGLVYLREGVPIAVVVLDVDESAITGIRIVMNPSKLRWIEPADAPS